MMRKAWMALAAAAATFGSAHAQERVFCEGAGCIPDTLEMDLGGSNELVIDDFVAGQEVAFQVFTNTVTARIQGWSFAVKHDTAVLSIVADSITTVGTIAHPDTPGAVAIPPNFDVSRSVDGGFISAIVLSFLSETELPVGSRSAILNGTYSIDADPGAEGTKQEFVSGEIGPPGSPATDINFTVDGASRSPASVIDGVIRKGGVVVDPEICDDGQDNDGDGDVDCADSDCVGVAPCGDETIANGNCEDGIDNDGDGLVDAADDGCEVVGGACPDGTDWAVFFGPAASTANFDATGAAEAPVTIRNATDAFAFQLGATYTDGTHAFAGTLGADAERLIELVITDQNGDSQTPATPNTMSGAQVTAVSRGAAIAGFEGGDFFAADVAPSVGGPGFTVGYVADLDGDDNRIPATPNADPCPVNEVLVLTLGGDTGGTEQFIRGDADGNGMLNVSDAVLIINVTLGNLQERYDCDDALDANDDGSANISDAIPVLMWLFERGAPLAAPHLACGQDPGGVADGLRCDQASPACGN